MKKQANTPNRIPSITAFIKKIEGQDSQSFMQTVNSYLTDEEIELFVDHIESFYGIDDDDSLGALTQLMITGFLAGFNEKENINFAPASEKIPGSADETDGEGELEEEEE